MTACVTDLIGPLCTAQCVHKPSPISVIIIFHITYLVCINSSHVVRLTFHSFPFHHTSIRLFHQGWAGQWRLPHQSSAVCYCCPQYGERWCAHVVSSPYCWALWRQIQTWRDCCPRRSRGLGERKEVIKKKEKKKKQKAVLTQGTIKNIKPC